MLQEAATAQVVVLIQRKFNDESAAQDSSPRLKVLV